MALTQTDLDALDTAIASSEFDVHLEGRRVRYRTMEELMKARAHVAELLSAGRTRRSSYTFDFRTSRGD
jgi:hypothetical protein